MAPLRRYLRITKHSVLEVRIYLDRPADAEAWLLKRENPALPRVIQAVRPLVLPKLREENERGKGKGGARAKKKGVKDVVIEDDFEVSIFLTELSSRHSVLTKQKVVKDKARIRSNSGKLTNWLTTGTSDQPLLVNDDAPETLVIREEDDDHAINLTDIPEADSQNDSDESALFVPGQPTKQGNTNQRTAGVEEEDADFQDDKKKLVLNTSYDGFSIYGRILCLVVKRRGVRAAPPSSQQMLENWVSTQAASDQIDDDEDAG
ncbi:hypothetical protein FB567DRAFT_450224 [Paraphoma chrysanthemicola]|uniref:Uncharacterized protein n=1 Tax=Paraphoma chrysanthemicola TaxID=798071 RepID=A0A8K0QZ18_9PLEO|nr:hypothetical protein FB567DRAFT_450224 [Paraphoma chrysanthemicola]